ncbi:tumor necrosis factor receptor superfamily member 14-like [Betta splendens]|uniref:Tumor necrosis factor receptor superfamily member 14-like n=1 Tax=Betta splendens TaxID=158456 RepID=A0A6P7MZE8_BETSP|nr:tumor necrosis factor receptor superfamily member 14-like [Betta splendens]
MTFSGQRWTFAALLMFVMNVCRGHALTCHQAEYLIGNECCPMCLPGNRVRTDCTEFRSTSCLPCLDGTYMDHPTGLKQCFLCTICHQGSGLRTMWSCTSTSDAVCEPLDGFYCVEPASHGCYKAQKHTSCEPGQYISRNGTVSSDTECSDCSNGTFSDGSFTSCQPHTQCDSENLQLVKAGTASSDAECEEQTNLMALVWKYAILRTKLSVLSLLIPAEDGQKADVH